ncbi:MAG: DUF3343 domain-containing protein [Acetivibrio sp.]
MSNYIITFYSHFNAIGFQKAMKKIGIASVLMPIPRHLSSSCGTCVKVTTMEEEVYDSFSSYDGIEKIFLVKDKEVILLHES